MNSKRTPKSKYALLISLACLAATLGLAGPASAFNASTRVRHFEATKVSVNGPKVKISVKKAGTVAKKTFKASTHEIISVVINRITTSDSGCATLVVLDPTGNQVNGSPYEACSGSPLYVGPFTVSVKGDYTVEFKAQKKETASGLLWVSAPISVGTAAVNKSSETMDVSRVGQGVERTFKGSIDQMVTVVVNAVTTSDSGCATLTVLDPTGNDVQGSSYEACSGDPLYVGPDTLTMAGSYTVLLQDDTWATGTASLWVSAPVSVGTVKVNGASEAMDVSRVGQGVERSFTGSSGDKIKATIDDVVTSDSGCVFITVYEPNGNQVGSNEECSVDSISVSPPKLGSTGTYIVLYQVDPAATGSGSLSVTAKK